MLEYIIVSTGEKNIVFVSNIVRNLVRFIKTCDGLTVRYHVTT